MDRERDFADLEEAIRRCRAGLAALEAARDGLARRNILYDTHVHVASVELAHAIETATKVVLRNA